MGEDGWLGIGWPKEYGGEARPLADQLIFVEEGKGIVRTVPFRAKMT